MFTSLEPSAGFRDSSRRAIRSSGGRAKVAMLMAIPAQVRKASASPRLPARRGISEK